MERQTQPKGRGFGGGRGETRQNIRISDSLQVIAFPTVLEQNSRLPLGVSKWACRTWTVPGQSCLTLLSTSQIPLKSDPPKGGPHASNLLNSRPSSLQGAKKSSFSQQSGHFPALPFPALRPHSCLGLHKGHTRATTEIGAVRRRRGLHPSGPPGRSPEATGPGLGSGRRRRPERGRRSALPLPPAEAPHPARPLRRAAGKRSHHSISSSTGSNSSSMGSGCLVRSLGTWPPAWHAPGWKGHSGTRA